MRQGPNPGDIYYGHPPLLLSFQTRAAGSHGVQADDESLQFHLGAMLFDQ